MIVHGIILIVSVATVLTTVAIVSKEYYKKIAATGGALIMWLAAAAGSPTMSYPYTRVVDNSIVSGVHHVSGPVSWLSWAWLGMAILVGLYLWYSVTSEGEKRARGIGVE